MCLINNPCQSQSQAPSLQIYVVVVGKFLDIGNIFMQIIFYVIIFYHCQQHFCFSTKQQQHSYYSVFFV